MAISYAYHGDCMDALKTFPDGFFDLACVDPPYGIRVTARHKATADGVPLVDCEARPFGGAKNRKPAYGGVQVQGCASSSMCGQRYYHAFDDSSPPDAEYFRELKRVSKNQIIWGGNFFLDNLGATNCLIVWDKKRRGLDQADCEIAWTSFKEQNRIFEFRWNGMLQGNMKNKEDRVHPTQKPVALYNWCFQRWCKPGDKILDTHLGSGSSRIAAYENNLDFYGYEIDEFYFKLQEDRFEKHRSQMSLFVNEGDSDFSEM